MSEADRLKLTEAFSPEIWTEEAIDNAADTLEICNLTCDELWEIERQLIKIIHHYKWAEKIKQKPDAEQKQILTITKLLKLNTPLEEIAFFFNIPIEKVLKIKEKLNANN